MLLKSLFRRVAQKWGGVTARLSAAFQPRRAAFQPPTASSSRVAWPCNVNSFCSRLCWAPPRKSGFITSGVLLVPNLCPFTNYMLGLFLRDHLIALKRARLISWNLSNFSNIWKETVKKKLLQNPWIFFVCVTKGILSFKVFKIHPVLLADEFTTSKNTQNANFTKNMTKKSFSKLDIVVIWSMIHILFFLIIFHVEKCLGFVLNVILFTQVYP